jgi:excisionase family DNA binding protein
MSKTLSQEDIKAIGKEFLSVVEKCLKNINLMQTTNANELMNVDEVSDKLKLSKQSIYKLFKDNNIESIKIGKQIYCRTSDLNKYLENKFNTSN